MENASHKLFKKKVLTVTLWNFRSNFWKNLRKFVWNLEVILKKNCRGIPKIFMKIQVILKKNCRGISKEF